MANKKLLNAFGRHPGILMLKWFQLQEENVDPWQLDGFFMPFRSRFRRMKGRGRHNWRLEGAEVVRRVAGSFSPHNRFTSAISCNIPCYSPLIWVDNDVVQLQNHSRGVWTLPLFETGGVQEPPRRRHMQWHSAGLRGKVRQPRSRYFISE